MADPRTLVRLLGEMLWRFRREGLAISVAQAVDVARAVRAVGLEDRFVLREAIACIVVARREERRAFDAAFDAFFGGPATGTYARMAEREFTAAEVEALRRVVAELDAETGVDLESLLEGGAGLDRRIARARLGEILDADAEDQLGFQAHRLIRATGVDRARFSLPRLRARLVAQLGVRGDTLAGEVAAALDRLDAALRAQVRRTFSARVAERAEAQGPLDLPFEALDEERAERVRRALRVFSERLRGSARVRLRRARRGRIDIHRTVRRSLGTGGVPFVLVWRRRARPRPKLIVLCDVSESMRAAARFMLELTAGAQDLFEGTRSFVFVSDLGETTDLFRQRAGRAALDAAWRGAGKVRTNENSNYGRVLRAFERTMARALDRRTIVVVLGDGRTNQHDAAPEVLDRLRLRVRSLLWLCPEPRSRWAAGDSAMSRYAPRCTRVFEVRSAADLERAARTFAR